MPGFKETIKSHDPVMFITFDGDPYDNFTRKLTANPAVFMDETPYQNHANLHNESEAYPAYRMGLPSAVDLEPTDQRSISFGWYGHQPAAPTRWPKAFIEVPHQVHMNLSENNSSFTFGMVLNKESNEQHWRTVEQSLGNQYNHTLTRTIIRKAGVFHFWYQDNWVSNDHLHVTYPGGQLSWVIPDWFYNKRSVITFTWDITEPNPDEFVGVATLYLNGWIIATATHNYFDSHPSSTSSAPIEIGGTINPSGTGGYNDRATTNTILDQIFLLNKALSPDEVARLYKKSRNYDSMIIDCQPQNYWPMADAESAVSTTMVDMQSNNNGVYLGGQLKVLREQNPPGQILGGSSVYFNNGGNAVVHNYSLSYYSPIFNPSSDFAVDFWFTFDNSSRSVLFALQRDETPFNGILVEANVRNNTNIPGHIQFTVNQDHFVSSRQTQDSGQPYNFADGKFHHLCAQRVGNKIQLWIDSVLHEEKDAPISPVPNPGPGQVYLMGAAPGRLNTTGFMSCVALYPRCLDPQEVRIRYTYSQIYRIKGAVTLEGTPHRATVRAISHRTGNLVQEVLSDASSGDYKIDLYDNSLIDLMALNKTDRNIRYRVFGPITPAVFEDLPL